MNLATIKARLLAARNWESSGDTFDERLRQAIDTAYHQIAADAGSALQPDEERLHLYGQIVPEDTVTANNTKRYLIANNIDEWVMEFVDASGSPYVVPAAGCWVPKVDGSWDGIMHLEFQDALGTWHRRQSREWWNYVDPAGNIHYYVSIDRPYTAPFAKDLMVFRIVQPFLYCRSTVRKILSVTPWDPSTKRPLVPIAETSLLQQGLYDIRGDSTCDIPSTWSAGPDHQLPHPLMTPVVTLTPPGMNWTGPHNPGTYRFAYTLVHGRRGREWQTQPGGSVMDPTWESHPSPPSIAITNPTAGGTARQIIIGLPDTDFSLNFGDATTLRYSRTGYRKRIYVCIDSIEKSAPWTHPYVEVDGNIYYYLDEVDGAVTAYNWTGSVIPDRLRRMPYSTGYSSITTWPTPTRDNILDLRVIRNPQTLMTDQDTPRLAPDAYPAYLELCLYHLCLMDGGDLEAAQLHLNHYQAMIGRVVADHSTPGGTVLPRETVRTCNRDWIWSGTPARRI